MSKILIVDNDEGLIHFLTRLFVKQGHEVVSCTDGISGLNRAKSASFTRGRSTPGEETSST